MKRFLILALSVALASVAFTGCLKNDDGGTGGTTPTTGGTSPPPQAGNSVVSTLTPEVGQLVTFDATKALDGGVKLGSVAWKFGDGDSAAGQTATHSYAMPGTYVVHVTVTNDKGVASTNDAALIYIQVSPKDVEPKDLSGDLAPIAVISASQQVLAPNTEVSFNGNASYGYVTNADFDDSLPIDGANAPATKDTHDLSSYEWDFGDGSAKVTGAATVAGEVKHTYATSGLYTAKLTVTGSNAKTGASAYTIYVLPTPPPSGSVKNPNVFTTVTINGPQSLDPGYDYENAGGQIIQNVYETLIYYDRDNFDRFVPVLAKELPTVANGGISADGKTYTFKLREGVKFHDGTELDASAVKFSLDRPILMNDPDSAAWISGDIVGASEYMESDGTAADRAAYLAKGGVEVVDKYTVKVHITTAQPSFLAKMAFYQAAIVSPTAFKAAHAERKAVWGVESTADGLPPAAAGGKPAVTRDPWADTNAIGTGAYKLRAWIANDRTILDRFEDYWGSKPAMRTIVIQYVDDVNTRILMLLSGDADDAFIPATVVDKVQGKPGVRVTEVESITVATIFFGQKVEEADNCPQDAKTGVADCEALNDVHMRAAITHAFEFDSYFKDIVKFRSNPIASVIPKGMFGFDAAVTQHKFDLTKAKAELAMSRHPDGLKNLKLATNSANTVRMQSLELLKQGLGQIGIQAEILGLSFPDLIDGYQDHKFPVWMIGWSPDYGYPDNYVVPFLDGRSGTYARGANYNDAAMNGLIDDAIGEPDTAKQLPIWREINTKAHDEYVHLWLSQAKNTHVERTWVTGYYYNPMDSGSPNFSNYAVAGKA